MIDFQSRLLLGGTIGDRWVSPESAADYMTGGEEYLLFSAKRYLGRTVGRKPVKIEPNVFKRQYVVPLMSRPPIHAECIGIDGSWNPFPRRPLLLNPASPELRRIATVFLVAKGFTQPAIRIDRAMRVDLEANGRREILFSASAPGASIHRKWAQPGDYSMVLLVEVLKGKNQAVLLDGEFFPPGRRIDRKPLTLFSLDGAMDLKGDGAMEAIVSWRYFEGKGVDVYSLKNGVANPVIGGFVGK